MSNTPSQFISVDWGTSNFRARLIESDTLTILDSISNDHGVKKVYDAFLKQTEKDQESFFLDFLLTMLEEITSKAIATPIIASGMVSSSIGLKELQYAIFPLESSAKSIRYELMKTPGGNDLFVISGARDEVGFMRGEEVQAIGLSEMLAANDPSTLILCGTHSKHLFYQDGGFQRMKNFMTGELFEVLVNHSLLRHSVDEVNFSKVFKSRFLTGVNKGVEEKLSSILLDVRYEDLIHKAKGEESYFFLSGMLIGNELAYLKNESYPVYLGANGHLFELYSIALKHVINEKRTHLIDQEIFEKATIKGHYKILNKHFDSDSMSIQ